MSKRVIAEIPLERRGAFLAMRLAIRPGEARALDWSEYDRERGALRVGHAMQGHRTDAPRRLTKEKTWRTVGIDQELAEWLEAQLRRFGPVFLSPTGQRWCHGSLEAEWYRACDRAGLARVGLYVGTKHATLSHMVRTGSTLYEAQAAAGHKSARSTQLYAKLEPVSPALSFRKRR